MKTFPWKLLLALCAAGSGIVLISALVLYSAALEIQSSNLQALSQTHANLIRAVAVFDDKNNSYYPNGGARGATLSQVKSAQLDKLGFGETGEFVIGELAGNEIRFLTSSRLTGKPIPPVSAQAAAAEPMRRALNGRSGLMNAPDYQGTQVLAWYESLSELNAGFVSKINIDEIQRPYFDATKVGLLVVLGASLFSALVIALALSKRDQSEKQLDRDNAQRDSGAGKGLYIGSFLLVGLVSVSTTIGVLFGPELERQKDELKSLSKGMASLINAVAKFDAATAESNAAEATILQVQNAVKRQLGFGATGETVLGVERNGSITFLLPSRFTGSVPLSVPMKGTKAESMRRALAGKSGIIGDLDYRGEKVMAAFAPVGTLNAGFVAKLDLDELWRPYILTAAVSITLAIFVITLASLFAPLILLDGKRMGSNPFSLTLSATMHSYVPKFAPFIIIGMLALVFYLDYLTPLGIAAGVPYISLLIIASSFVGRREILGIALAASALVFIGWAIAPDEGVLLYTVLANRFYALLTIWLAAVIVMRFKDAETATYQSEKRLISVMEAAPDASLIVTKDGRIAFANIQAEKLFKYSRAELESMKVEALVPPDVAPRHPQLREKFVDTDDARPMGAGKNLMAMDRHGQLFPVEVSLSPIETEDGHVVAASIRDISERKQAQDELASKEALLSMTMANMPGATWVVDPDLKLLSANNQYVEIYGDTHDIVRPGTPIINIVRQEAEAGLLGGSTSVDEAVDERMRSYQSLLPSTFEDKTIDGRIVSLRRQPTDDGHIISIATDITEQKEREIEIAAAREIIEKTLENMDQGILMVDANLDLLVCNERAEQFLGFEKGTMMQVKTFSNLLTIFLRDLNNIPEWEEHLERSLETIRANKPATYDFQFRDNTYVEVRHSPLSDGGFVRTFTDITDRKAAEREVERALDYSRQVNAEIEAVIETIDYGVCFLDKDLHARLINNAFKVMWGIDDSLIDIRPSMAELMHSIHERGLYPIEVDDLDAYVESRVEAVRQGGIPPKEMSRRDGTILVYQCIVLPDGGRLLTYYDKTAQKRNEQNLTDAYDVISSSIQYASRIQKAVLTGEEMMKFVMSDYFVIWEPRDVVGGDIYWCRPWGHGVLVIAADCTGHGVPGAFMTLISAGALDRAMGEVEPGQLGALIRKMHLIIQFTLNQHGGAGESDDGLELSACFFDIDANSLTYSGARLALFIVENDEVTVLNGTKSRIGYRGISETVEFEETVIDMSQAQSFYMVTDGLIDQIGGERRRAFGKKRFQELILTNQDLPFEEQGKKIVSALAEYQGEETRRDDVTVIGFKP